jgi:hypothetical protein
MHRRQQADDWSVYHSKEIGRPVLSYGATKHGAQVSTTAVTPVGVAINSRLLPGALV